MQINQIYIVGSKQCFFCLNLKLKILSLKNNSHFNFIEYEELKYDIRKKIPSVPIIYLVIKDNKKKMLDNRMFQKYIDDKLNIENS